MAAKLCIQISWIIRIILETNPSYHFTHIKYVNMSLYDPTSDISNLYVFQWNPTWWPRVAQNGGQDPLFEFIWLNYEQEYIDKIFHDAFHEQSCLLVFLVGIFQKIYLKIVFFCQNPRWPPRWSPNYVIKLV